MTKPQTRRVSRDGRHEIVTVRPDGRRADYTEGVPRSYYGYRIVRPVAGKSDSGAVALGVIGGAMMLSGWGLGGVVAGALIGGALMEKATVNPKNQKSKG